MNATRGYRSIGIVALAMILGAPLLGIVTAGDNVLTADWRFSRWIQQWQGNIPEVLYEIGNILGDTVTAVVVMVALLIIAAVMRARRFIAFFVAVGLLRLVGTMLKPIFDSPRPTETIRIEPEVRIRIYEGFENTGYPSGHSMTAAMLGTVLVVTIWATMRARNPRWLAVFVAAVLALFVGWSRIWSGAHWPTDVLGGWSYGFGLVLLAWIITTPFADSDTGREQEPTPEVPQTAQ